MCKFLEELDIIIKNEYSEEVLNLINNPNIDNVLLRLKSDNIYKLLEKYNLSNITLKLFISNNNISTEYYYKNRKVEPDCYWVRPKNYREPTILEILKECILQDTYKPNIKHLESIHK